MRLWCCRRVRRCRRSSGAYWCSGTTRAIVAAVFLLDNEQVVSRLSFAAHFMRCPQTILTVGSRMPLDCYASSGGLRYHKANPQVKPDSGETGVKLKLMLTCARRTSLQHCIHM